MDASAAAGGLPIFPMALLCAARTRGETLCPDELEARARDEPGSGLVLALSREGSAGGADRAAVDAALALLPGAPTPAVVRGATDFVHAMARLLADAGIAPRTVRTERFGRRALPRPRRESFIPPLTSACLVPPQRSRTAAP